MKKTALAAKTLTVLLAAGLISCADNKANNENTGAPAAANAANTESATAINIRYVDIDSVMSAYTLAKELNEQGRKIMLDYQRMENQKRNEIQSLGASIEQKRNSNGYLSQESFDADVNSLNRKQTEAANSLGAHQ